MIISRKRFEEEVDKRVKEAVCKCEESYWEREREKAQCQFIEKLEHRIIALEKQNGIDHPSHHRGDNCSPIW